MEKILLAEDDLFLRDIYTEILQGEGFDVTVAVDGREALTKICMGGWDLVLLDIFMPKLSGMDILREIKDKPPRSLAKHIVIMTNSDDTTELKQAIAMTDGFILKSSFTPDKLLEQIRKYLSA